MVDKNCKRCGGTGIDNDGSCIGTLCPECNGDTRDADYLVSGFISEKGTLVIRVDKGRDFFTRYTVPNFINNCGGSDD